MSKRYVAGEQDHRAITTAEEGLRLLQRVSRPELRRLHDTLSVPATLDTAPDGYRPDALQPRLSSLG